MKRFKRKASFRLESPESRRLLNALTVTSAADSGMGSLRAQVAAAHSGDSINFAPGLAGQTITLTSGEIAITKNLTIEGPGGDGLAVSGNDSSRVFAVTGGTTTHVEIRSLTITHGCRSYGGGIYNNGVLTLIGCTFSENAAVADGTINGTRGGAVCSEGGTLTVSNCTFFDNRALGGQVPVYDLDSKVLLGFEGLDAYGGAMCVEGGVTRSANWPSPPS
jgi:hypothetical protein